MSDESRSPAGRISSKEFAELLSKASIGLFGLCYACGLIVVNIYLSKFGVFSTELFRLHYVTAGAWALLSLTTPFLIVFLIVGASVLMSKRVREFINRRFLLNLPLEDVDHWYVVGTKINFAILAGVLVFILYRFSKAPGSPVFIGNVYSSLLTTGWSVLILGVIYLMTMAKPHVLSRIASIYILSGVIVLLIMGNISSFARNVYGTIPAHLGGGSPRSARLMINTDPATKSYLKAMGINFQENTNLTEAVDVLVVTDHEYILLTNELGGSLKNQGVSIRRDMVQAVLYKDAK